MAIVKLPSGKTAKIPDGMSEQDAGRFIYDKLRDTPGAESDASAIAQRFGFETTGVGQTVGGTVGAAGGAAAGAALGTLGGPFAPLTVPLGAIAGSALLGGVGGAAGEYAEAELKGVEGDPLEAASEEALWGLIPGGAAAPVRAAAKGTSLLTKAVPHIASSQLTDAIGKNLGKYANKLNPADAQAVAAKAQKEYVERFLKTSEGKQLAKQAGFKLDADTVKRLGNDREFLENALKASPKSLKNFERKLHEGLVAELIRTKAISRTQKAAALSLLAKGASLDELDGGPKLPGEGGRGLL